MEGGTYSLVRNHDERSLSYGGRQLGTENTTHPGSSSASLFYTQNTVNHVLRIDAVEQERKCAQERLDAEQQQVDAAVQHAADTEITELDLRA